MNAAEHYPSGVVAEAGETKTGLVCREILGLPDGFYNAGAWQENGQTYLLGRYVTQPGAAGRPDIGSLILARLDERGNAEDCAEVWRPAAGTDLFLEDARVLQLGRGGLAIGLTAAEYDGRPHPALLYASGSADLLNGYLYRADILTQLSGKNVTPISDSEFIYRPEGDLYNHRLQLCRLGGGTVETAEIFDVPNDLPWGRSRIGATMPPIAVNGSEAVFPLHGFNSIDSKFVYSISSARLARQTDGRLRLDCTNPEPLIYPDMFAGAAELHPNRRVVYCCGGLPVYDEAGQLDAVKMIINVGDTRTVEVKVPAGRLTAGWPQAEELAA